MTRTLLHDVRVLDASRVLAGPWCGQMLGDLGAEVVKVERPGQGDETRGWGPPFLGEWSAYFLSCNRNKKAIALDLADDRGRDLFYKLVGKADVVLENFKAQSAEKLGLSPEKLLEINPRLIVCSISGYGRTGPMRDLPGYDFAIQGLSGLMDITGPVDGPPSKVGVAITDVLAGLNAALAILACLHARKSSGHGYAIDLALLDCAVAAQVNLAQAFLTTGEVPPRQGNAHLQIVPYQAFQTADDWIILAVGNDGQFQRLCETLGRTEWAKDPKYATNAERVRHRDQLVSLASDAIRTKPLREWQAAWTAAGVPHAPVWNYEQLFASPQIAERGMKVRVKDPTGREVDLIGSPFHVTGGEVSAPTMPPRLGEHTEEIIREWLNESANVQ